MDYYCFLSEETEPEAEQLLIEKEIPHKVIKDFKSHGGLSEATIGLVQGKGFTPILLHINEVVSDYVTVDVKDQDFPEMYPGCVIISSLSELETLIQK